MLIKKITAVLLLFLFARAVMAEDITAKSWLVMDSSGQVLEAEHQDTIRSVASITKLMTVLVVLDQETDLERKVPLKHNLASSKRISKYQRQLSVGDLIVLSMVASDNLAAANLCGVVPPKKRQKNNKYPCVAAMNAKARSLGMHSTRFVEPTGLNPKNTSTAEDLAKLVVAASKYDIVVAASKTSSGEVKTAKSAITFKNTNSLVNYYNDIIVSKTGWTRAAGGCVVMFVGAGIDEKIIIVLGSKSVRTRINEADALIQKNKFLNKDTHSLQESSINIIDNRELR